MKMYFRPRALWILAATALLIIPLLILNVSVYERSSILKSLLSPSMRAVIPIAVWSIATSYWIFQARRIGFWSYGLMSGVILYGNIYFLVTTKNYGLAFFALGSLILSAFFAINLYQTLSLVFFDSGRTWYEQYPRFIPKLEGVLVSGEKEVPARISRIGTEGCFLFSKRIGDKPELLRIHVTDGKIRPLEFPVQLVARTRDRTGAGLSFKVKTADQAKDLNDFIDKLRSYGYV